MSASPRLTKLLFMTGVLALLVACSSAPVRFHSLIDSDDRGCRPDSVASGATMPPLLIEVVPVHVARIFNTADMILRQADGSLQVREGDYWSSPLPDELRSAISFGLQERLCAIDTYYLESSPGKTQYRIRTELLKADLNPRAQFHGSIRWVVQRVSDSASLTGKTIVDTTVPAGVDGQLIGYKRLARSVAADLAVVVKSLESQL